MLSTIWSKRIRGSFLGSCNDEGLRVLTKLANGNSYVVVKPIFLHNQTVKSASSTSDDDSSYSCFLKSCHLCRKPLCLDKEVYMYMGDLGFCSVDCRERQIYLDEMKEIEASTQRILTSFRQRRRDGGGRCETTNLLVEFRQRRRPFTSEKTRVIFS
ncbi:FCS-Like Zinc finger 17 [Sesamum alatum]|uniref:FCS-Like Zinc finger 17 n=1 Tax=Sesamum alatum TaxID=300844 RepID=A0AAE1XKW8_9LAMI|nr:FCS-Like Zinc finger 17 [Sesamum alatum]